MGGGKFFGQPCIVSTVKLVQLLIMLLLFKFSWYVYTVKYDRLLDIGSLMLYATSTKSSWEIVTINMRMYVFKIADHCA